MIIKAHHNQRRVVKELRNSETFIETVAIIPSYWTKEIQGELLFELEDGEHEINFPSLFDAEIKSSELSDWYENGLRVIKYKIKGLEVPVYMYSDYKVKEEQLNAYTLRDALKAQENSVHEYDFNKPEVGAFWKCDNRGVLTADIIEDDLSNVPYFFVQYESYRKHLELQHKT